MNKSSNYPHISLAMRRLLSISTRSFGMWDFFKSAVSKNPEEMLKGMDPSKIAELMKNPMFMKMMEQAMGKDGMKIPPDQIATLKQDPDYKSAPVIKDFVDALEKEGTLCIPRFGQDPKVKEFTQKFIKSFSK